jgi:flavin reductase (DIM6/NTAB) family NADH-FMN oxidoreductase RutF
MTNKLIKHKVVNLPVLYVGNSVALITTCNEDGTINISPISSTWALGDRFVCGISSESKCHENMILNKECVINFPSASMASSVEKIARGTGKNPVPPHKVKMGYEYIKDKFKLSGLTAIASEIVKPSRIIECPIQIEGIIVSSHKPGGGWSDERPETFSIVEVLVKKVHAHEDILLPDSNHIDTSCWHPLLYVFRHYFGTGQNIGKTFKS